VQVGSNIAIVADCIIKSSVAVLALGIEINTLTFVIAVFDDGLNHRKTAPIAGSHETGVCSLFLMMAKDGQCSVIPDEGERFVVFFGLEKGE